MYIDSQIDIYYFNQMARYLQVNIGHFYEQNSDSLPNRVHILILIKKKMTSLKKKVSLKKNMCLKGYKNLEARI